jgi:hypothetical protein
LRQFQNLTRSIDPSELLPLHLRQRGAALTVIIQWLTTFLIVEITPPMITNIGYKSYIIFAAINLAAIPMVYFFFPETARLPLEAVDLLFSPMEDGAQPGILRVVRRSVDKNFVAAIEVQSNENTDVDIKEVDLAERIEKV